MTELDKMKKEVNMWGNTCEFASEEQAQRFVRLYAAQWGDFEETYNFTLEWQGPGKYQHSDPKQIHRPMYSDQGPTIYEAKFIKRNY